MTSGPEPVGVEEYEGSAEGQAAAITPAGSGQSRMQALWSLTDNEANLNAPTGYSSGPTRYASARIAERGGESIAETPLTTTVGALMQALNGAGVLARKHYQAALQQAGFLKADYVPNGDLDKATVQAFGDFFVEFARQGIENPMVDWTSYLAQRARTGAEGAAEAEKLKNPPKVRLLSYSEAAPAYRETFRQAVGREPSDVEINAFVDSYNAQAKASPQVTKVEMRDGVEYTSVEGGVDANDVATQMAQENPDYANYQAVATYFPALEQILSAPTDINTVGF